MLKVSSKGQITLPKKARQAIGLLPGHQLVVESTSDSTITLRRVKDISEFRGVLKDVFPQDAVAAVREIRDREYDDCL